MSHLPISICHEGKKKKREREKHCRGKEDQSLGLPISKPLTINKHSLGVPGTRNPLRLVEIQIPGTHLTSIESDSAKEEPEKLLYGEQPPPPSRANRLIQQAWETLPNE